MDVTNNILYSIQDKAKKIIQFLICTIFLSFAQAFPLLYNNNLSHFFVGICVFLNRTRNLERSLNKILILTQHSLVEAKRDFLEICY